jgi:hypothetical protein
MPLKMMLCRKLVLASPEPDTNGKLFYALSGSGEVGEGDIANEFVGLAVRHSPCLDPKSGRLLPGFKLEDTYDASPEVMLSDPDKDGVSHVEGIKIPTVCKNAVLADLATLGYEIDEREA